MEANLEGLYENMDTSDITKEYFIQERDLVKEIHRLHHKEEEKWRLKSRSLWLQAGHQNTKFFHQYANHKKMPRL